jgi:DNA-binding FrmR family transcriptional regulator
LEFAAIYAVVNRMLGPRGQLEGVIAMIEEMQL